MTNYLKQYNPNVTPQSEAIAGTVANNAGGYSFPVDKWTQFDRFLIIGSEGGSYYVSEQKLTRENARNVEACIAEDGPRAIMRIVQISDEGRAAKNDPALFALALAASAKDEGTRSLALSVLPQVARTGTHLFHFVSFVQNFRGWGRGLRDAISAWYVERSDKSLANQLIKYQSRDGWSHRDVLRLAHTRAKTPFQNAMFSYVVHKDFDVTEVPDSEALRWVGAADELLHTTDEKRALELIEAYRLPREMVPTQLLNSPKVWEALLPHMGITAMLRNLGKMGAVGLLTPLSEAEQIVAQAVSETEVLRAGRVHPLQVLSALRVYSSGHGVRGSLSWAPVPGVRDALEAGFYAAFGAVEPSNKRTLLALDVSGSMTCGLSGVPGLTAREGAAVMAMVTARVEPRYHFMSFQRDFVPLDITATSTLEQAIQKTRNLPFGSTDCALPMIWALEHKIPVDTFAVYTDSETWAGYMHPSQALNQYRRQMNIPAKLVVVGMVSNGFSIADPQDSGMLDVVGFDTATPTLLAEFAKGGF